MKYLFIFITTSVIIFFIFLGMAAITTRPQNIGFFEVNETINISYIKTNKSKPLAQLNTPSVTASLNMKSKKPDHSGILKTHIFSDTYSPQGELVENIDIKNMFPKSPTHFKNALTPLIDNTNQGSQVLNPLYPYEAYRNNISGWVILKLFISKVGKVVDVEVLDSSPKGIFENTAIKAAYKREFPIDENILEPKAFTKNILSKYNVANHNL